MASLRDEHLMLHCLKILEKKEAETVSKIEPTSYDEALESTYPEYFISEPTLRQFFVERKSKWYRYHSSMWKNSDLDFRTHEAQRIIMACEMDGFIKRRERYWEPEEDIRFLQERLWRITETDGDNLLIWSNYWFRYVPSRFPEPARLLFSVTTAVVTAALTSGAIWLWVLDKT